MRWMNFLVLSLLVTAAWATEGPESIGDSAAGVQTNDWKALHAAALECAEKKQYLNPVPPRWKAVSLMDQAYRQARSQQIADEALCGVIEDYIDLLLLGRDSAPSLLSANTLELTEAEARALNSRPIPLEQQLQFVPYACPSSYETATNDGERVRWLIQRSTTPRYFSGRQWLTHRGMADFALLQTGTHRIAPVAHTSKHREALRALKDHEMLTLTANHQLTVQVLPIMYRSIDTYKRLAASGDQTAATTLGNLYFNRYQFENAAHYYELGGATNEANSIRANYGRIESCPAQTAGLPASFDYAFRNGTNLTIEIVRYPAGTNLTERLKAATVKASELRFLTDRASPSGPYGVKPSKVTKWTIPLHPEPDHQDGTQAIELPPLPAGNYQVRATMQDGNTVSRNLLLNDTLVLLAKARGESITTANYVFLFLDTATGEPLANTTFHLLKIGKNDTVSTLMRRQTDRLGHYVFKNLELNQLDETLLLVERKDRGLVAVRVPYDPSYYGYNEFLGRDIQNQHPVFCLTDRTTYRPGDSGSIKVAMGSAPRPIELEIKSNRSNIPFKVDGLDPSSWKLEPDAYGGGVGQFNIPDDKSARWGRVVVAGEERSRTSFKIEQNPTPQPAPSETLNLSATLDPSGLIELRVTDAAGNALSNRATRISLDFSSRPRASWCPENTYDARLGRGYWWHGGQFENRAEEDESEPSTLDASTTQTSDASGRISINLADFNAMDFLHSPGAFNIHAEVNAQNGQWIRVPSLPQRWPLCCWLDKAFYQPSEAIQCHVAAEDPLDEVTIELISVTDTNQTLMDQFPVEDGAASLGNLPAGLYEARAKSGDLDSKPFRFTVLGAPPVALSSEHPLRIVREKGSYEPGGSARILIQTDRPGRHIQFFSNDLRHGNAVFKMDATERVINLPIPSSAESHYPVKALVMEKGEPYFAGCAIPVIHPNPAHRTGSVAIEPRLHGETARITLRATDDRGQGRPCSIALSVHTENTDRLKGAEDFIRANLGRMSSRWISNWYVQMYDNWPTRHSSRKPPRRLMNHPYFQEGLPFKMRQFRPREIIFFDSVPRFGHDYRCHSEELINYAPEPSTAQIQHSAVPFRSAYWNPNIETNSEGEALIEFPMPGGDQEWKISAWAFHTNFTAIGEAMLNQSEP